MNTSIAREASPIISAAFRGKSFLSTADFPRPALSALLDLAVQHKHGLLDPGTPLTGKSVALVFLDPSLRTRTSMTIAIQHLGGVPVPLNVGTEAWALEFEDGAVMDGDSVEHIKEAAPVLSRYVDAIAVRSFPWMKDYEKDKSEIVLHSFERFSDVPVFNMESSLQHPMQGLGDVMTVRDRFGTVDGRRLSLCWAYHPKALPMSVPNSVALAAAQYGMDLTIAAPPGFELDSDLMSDVHRYAERNGSTVRTTQDLEAACRGAEVVYAKSWVSREHYGDKRAERRHRDQYRDWMITSRLMDLTKKGYFMHCLPVRRNVVVEDAVLDSPRSIVVEQSANRLHIQKTLLSVML